jgi:alpha-glucuronidase
MMRLPRLLLIICAAIGLTSPALADDGYDLWLRYRPLPAEARAKIENRGTAIVTGGQPSPMLAVALGELNRGLAGLLGHAVGTDTSRGAIYVGTPRSLPVLATLDLPLREIGPEGFVIRSRIIDGRPATVIAANDDRGLLYGSFALLRRLQTGGSLDFLDIVSSPKMTLRVLNHWDDLNGHIERGYAGNSLWDWWKLPDYKDPRYTDYARANASIGINGTVLNNVNASATSLTPEYIAKAAALADVFRPWGIKVYLSARFTAPIDTP